MDKPPEHQDAKIVPLFKQYEPKSPEQSPKPPNARIVELPDAPRRQSSDEDSDTSLEEQPQGAEIIEFPSTPTSLRQQASELISEVLAGEEKEHSGDPQHEKIDKKEAAKTIAKLLTKAHEELDDNPRNNCTIELGRLVMALVALDSKVAEALKPRASTRNLEEALSFLAIRFFEVPGSWRDAPYNIWKKTSRNLAQKTTPTRNRLVLPKNYLNATIDNS